MYAMFTDDILKEKMFGKFHDNCLTEKIRPPSCTCRLIWTKRTFWGWWDDTALQTQDSTFEPWCSRTLTPGHGGSPQYWIVTSELRRNFFVNLKVRVGLEPAISDFPAGSFNHCTRAPALSFTASPMTAASTNHIACTPWDHVIESQVYYPIIYNGPSMHSSDHKSVNWCFQKEIP